MSAKERVRRKRRESNAALTPIDKQLMSAEPLELASSLRREDLDEPENVYLRAKREAKLEANAVFDDMNLNMTTYASMCPKPVITNGALARCGSRNTRTGGEATARRCST